MSQQPKRGRVVPERVVPELEPFDEAAFERQFATICPPTSCATASAPNKRAATTTNTTCQARARAANGAPDNGAHDDQHAAVADTA